MNEIPFMTMNIRKLIDTVEKVPDDAEIYLSVNGCLADGNGKIGDIDVLCGEYCGKNRNVILFSTTKAVGNPFTKMYNETATLCSLIKTLNHYTRMTRCLLNEPNVFTNAFTSVSSDVYSADTLLYAYCGEYGLLPIIAVKKMRSKRTGKLLVVLMCKVEVRELEKELTLDYNPFHKENNNKALYEDDLKKNREFKASARDFNNIALHLGNEDDKDDDDYEPDMW